MLSKVGGITQVHPKVVCPHNSTAPVLPFQQIVETRLNADHHDARSRRSLTTAYSESIVKSIVAALGMS